MTATLRSQSTADQGLGDKAKYIFLMKTIDIMCEANALSETNICSMVDVYYNKNLLVDLRNSFGSCQKYNGANNPKVATCAIVWV